MYTIHLCFKNDTYLTLSGISITGVQSFKLYMDGTYSDVLTQIDDQYFYCDKLLLLYVQVEKTGE